MCVKSGTLLHAPALPKLPPAPCPEHSSRWPTATPCASRRQSSRGHWKWCSIGPRNSAASATRPVSTMSAPCASACAMGSAPRYTLANTRRSRTVSMDAPVSRCASDSPAARSSSMRASMASPVTTAMRARSPFARSACASASRAPCGLRPPAFSTNFTPARRAAGHRSSSIGTRSRAQPSAASRARSFCRMARVSSAR